MFVHLNVNVSIDFKFKVKHRGGHLHFHLPFTFYIYLLSRSWRSTLVANWEGHPGFHASLLEFRRNFDADAPTPFQHAVTGCNPHPHNWPDLYPNPAQTEQAGYVAPDCGTQTQPGAQADTCDPAVAGAHDTSPGPACHTCRVLVSHQNSGEYREAFRQNSNTGAGERWKYHSCAHYCASIGSTCVDSYYGGSGTL